MRIRVRPRRALATLEMALALPFLVFMAAVIFKVAEASLAKTDTALLARHDGWKARDEALQREARPLPDETLFRAALRLDGQQGHGVSDEEKSRTVRLEPAALTSTKLGTHLVVLQGTWDHRSIEFRDDRPHLQPDVRAWTVAAVGALSPEATGFDVNATDPTGGEFLTKLIDFDLRSLIADDQFEKIAQQALKAAEPQQMQQAEDIAKALKNPAKAAKDLLNTFQNLDQIGDAISKLEKAPDAISQLGDQLHDLMQGVEALKDLGADAPGLDQAAEVSNAVAKVGEVVGPIKDGLGTLKKALERLKKNPADALKDLIPH